VHANTTAFAGVAALVILAPGPDTALVTKNALRHGRRAALATSFGVVSGLIAWTLAAALGIAAIVRASETAFTVLKLVGAAYLIYLGAQALRASREAGGLLTRPRVRTALERVTGVVLIGLGLRLVTERR
jgi:threonine/homoserine/homoserine lactone efflux protein